jgi:uncharacterized damage-inducible protein DinB
MGTSTAAEPVIVALFRHNTWANLALIDACAALTDQQLEFEAPGTFGSIRHTLTHMIGNEENYLSLLTSWRPEKPLRRGESLELAELRSRQQAAGAALAREAARIRLTDTITQEYEGQETTLPAFIILIQAIQHSAEHRAHIATIMSQHGISPPAIDGWAYADEVAKSR